MTIDEISRRYGIEVEKLKFFQKNSLIKLTNDFNDRDLKEISFVCTLYDCGMNTETVKRVMGFDYWKGNTELLTFLNTYRNNLLVEIHKKQKKLDMIDYIICEI